MRTLINLGNAFAPSCVWKKTVN